MEPHEVLYNPKSDRTGKNEETNVNSMFVKGGPSHATHEKLNRAALTETPTDHSLAHIPKTFIELINMICFKLHHFTTVDLLVHGIRFVSILLLASIVLPSSLFHILLFILIIVLSIVYIFSKHTFGADKVNVPVNKQRLANFRSRTYAYKKPTSSGTGSIASVTSETDANSSSMFSKNMNN